jgi:hypothetical protein
MTLRSDRDDSNMQTQGGRRVLRNLTGASCLTSDGNAIDANQVCYRHCILGKAYESMSFSLYL